jgi:dynein heavy chain
MCQNKPFFNTSNQTGPMSELDYWRRRMQQLTNITEQLKTKDCKMVIGALSSVTKVGGVSMV